MEKINDKIKLKAYKLHKISQESPRIHSWDELAKQYNKFN